MKIDANRGHLMEIARPIAIERLMKIRRSGSVHVVLPDSPNREISRPSDEATDDEDHAIPTCPSGTDNMLYLHHKT